MSERPLTPSEMSAAVERDMLREAIGVMVPTLLRCGVEHRCGENPWGDLDRKASADVLARVEAALKRSEPAKWADTPTPEDETISAAFPTRSGRHDLYQEAMRLVGARHSKSALVSLVTWLLLRIEQGERMGQVSPGERINRRAELGSRIVTLKAMLVEMEKTSRKTPPKSLYVERNKVEQAKRSLPVLRSQLLDAECEHAALVAQEEEQPTANLLSELRPLAEHMAKGRQKYPDGCTVLSLLDEAGEVAHAVNKYEPAERIRSELLDVAGVAMRLYLGEIDRGLQQDGLVQVRTNQGAKK